MPSLNSRNKYLTFPIIVILLVVSLLLILFDNIGLFNPVKDFCNRHFVSLTDGPSHKLEQIIGITKLFEEKSNLLKENERLRVENEKVLAENVKIKITEEQRLLFEKQLQFTRAEDTIPTFVTNYISDKFGHVAINKGSDDQVRVGDPLVIQNYLLGEVVEITKTSSVVRLINSPDSTFSVLTLSNNAKGVVKGDFTKGLIMSEIPRGSTITQGELVITSAENQFLQKGLILGEVIRIDDQDSLTTKIADLKIIPDLNNLEEAFILNINNND